MALKRKKGHVISNPVIGIKPYDAIYELYRDRETDEVKKLIYTINSTLTFDFGGKIFSIPISNSVSLHENRELLKLILMLAENTSK